MKGFIKLIMILSMILSLSACGLFEDQTKNDDETPIVKEEPVVTDEDDPVPVVTDDGGNDDPVPVVTDDDDENEAPPVEEKVYENASFKEVTVTEKDGLIVTGKAQVFEGVFQYAIVADNKVLKEGMYQTDGAPAWGEFEILIDKELASTKGAKLELFFYSANDGAKTNTLEIPLNHN